MRGICTARQGRRIQVVKPMNASGLSPTKLQQAFSEIVLVLLGGLLMYLGASGIFSVERRSAAWIGLGILIFYRGVRSFVTARSSVCLSISHWEGYLRGGSLLVVGAIMLGTAGLPPVYAGPLLGTAGAILVLRGLANAALALRPR